MSRPFSKQSAAEKPFHNLGEPAALAAGWGRTNTGNEREPVVNPIVFALRHPITMMMLVVALLGGGLLALNRMRTDMFPPINQPEIYVFVNYGGMDPGQMEGLIVNQFELEFQYVDGVRTIESKCIQQVALIKLSFYPGTDMAKAMAQVVSQANRAESGMPPNTLPPRIMQMDAGSVPVGYLVFKSKTRSLGDIGDLAQNRIRALVQARVPGTVATSPFGTSQRSIVVSVDPDKLQGYNLTPQDVVNAIGAGNSVSPSGNLYILDQMPLVINNAMIRDPKEFGSIPLQPGRTVYLRDVGTVADATDINYGYALVDGRKSVYLPIIKKNTSSTLQVVADVHKAMPAFKSVLPDDVDISFAFDESPTVVTAVDNVATEGLIGATLTGLMILIFLRDWRSVLVVVFNIPLALLGSLCALWLLGHTINLMTLGGLALAIGILVDEATVEIENIHVQMDQTPSLSRAVLRGNHITAVPRLLAAPVHPVGVHPSLPNGRAGAVAVRAAGAVGRVRHDLVVRPLQHRRAGAVGLAFEAPRSQGGGRREEGGIRTTAMDSLRAFVAVCHPFLSSRCRPRLGRLSADWCGCGFGWWCQRMLFSARALLGGLGPRVGTELFPQVDSGEFVLTFHAPPGSNFEITRQISVKGAPGDSGRGRGRERKHLDGLRRAAATRLLRELPRPVHAWPGQRADARGPARRKRRPPGSVSRAATEGLAGEGETLASETAPGVGVDSRVREGASRAGDFRLRAG